MAAPSPWDLTGRAGGPSLVPPEGLSRRIEGLGGPLGVDVPELLAERAATSGLWRRSPATCGGAGRLVRGADAWLAVNLAREDDRRAVAAWLEDPSADDDPWAAVERALPGRTAGDLVARAALLGLPVAALGETPAPPGPVAVGRTGPGRPPMGTPRVVDLSALWAGPLCTRLLAEHGADVVKVEAPDRPDGARHGDPAFFARLNGAKEQQRLALDSSALRELVAGADVVVTSARARALAPLGLPAGTVRPHVWVAITGHGLASDRVAFGDDAAVSGGLVAWDGEGPCFVADAVADPLTGVAAASAVAELLEREGTWVVDAAMAGVAAHVAGPYAGRRWAPGHRRAV